MSAQARFLDGKKELRRGFIFAALGALMFLLASFLMTPSYTARVSLLPQNEEGNSLLLGQLSGIAGFSLEGAASPEELFGKILESESLLSRAASRKWSYRGEEDQSLYAVYGLDEPGPRDLGNREELLKKLRRGLSFQRDPRTGYMEMKLRAPHDAEFAAKLAAFLVEELEAFNLEYRQGRAREQRQFVEGREGEIRAELESAEEALSDFVKRNQLYAQSPNLLRRQQRLLREVETLATVWAELRGQLELARIEEADQKPSLNLLDAARPPTKRSSPRYALNAILGALFGLVLAGARLLIGVAGSGSRD
jgi:uncharacterized protein involved in exopolysaccharide biosynthesis